MSDHAFTRQVWERMPGELGAELFVERELTLVATVIGGGPVGAAAEKTYVPVTQETYISPS